MLEYLGIWEGNLAIRQQGLLMSDGHQAKTQLCTLSLPLSSG